MDTLGCIGVFTWITRSQDLFDRGVAPGRRPTARIIGPARAPTRRSNECSTGRTTSARRGTSHEPRRSDPNMSAPTWQRPSSAGFAGGTSHSIPCPLTVTASGSVNPSASGTLTSEACPRRMFGGGPQLTRGNGLHLGSREGGTVSERKMAHGAVCCSLSPAPQGTKPQKPPKKKKKKTPKKKHLPRRSFR